jgi:hypothetical protein
MHVFILKIQYTLLTIKKTDDSVVNLITVKGWLKETVLQFILIGVIVFLLDSVHPETESIYLPLGARRLSFSDAPTAHPCADGAYAASLPLLRKTTVRRLPTVHVVSGWALDSLVNKYDIVDEKGTVPHRSGIVPSQRCRRQGPKAACRNRSFTGRSIAIGVGLRDR